MEACREGGCRFLIHRMGRELGSLTTAVGDLDALIVTNLHARLGIELNEDANPRRRTLSGPASVVSSWAI